MNKERLLRLAIVLDGVKPDTFNLVHWFEDGRATTGRKVSKSSCGFVACAVGWGCMDPELQAQGLTLNEYQSPSINGDDVGGWWAVEQFFDINRLDAYELFHHGSYAMRGLTAPSTVAKKIRAFVAKWEADHGRE